MPLLPSLRGLVRGTEKAKILPGNNGMYVCMYVCELYFNTVYSSVINSYVIT